MAEQMHDECGLQTGYVAQDVARLFLLRFLILTGNAMLWIMCLYPTSDTPKYNAILLR